MGGPPDEPIGINRRFLPALSKDAEGQSSLNTSEATSKPVFLDAESELNRQTATPFLVVAIAWLVMGEAVSAWFSAGKMGHSLSWTMVLWALCVLDLYALSRAVGAALAVMSDSDADENRGPLVVRALYWGVLKLTCLGILGLALSYGRSIPVAAMLMGIGTAVVVPLVGGYGWSQKVLRHARG